MMKNVKKKMTDSLGVSTASITRGKTLGSKKSLDTKALIAFGLASLLPSFACADESIEKIQKVFDSQDRDSQKIKKLDGYSPVADLRSQQLRVANGDEVFAKDPVIINQNTIIGDATTDADRWNVTTNRPLTKASKNITINNDATLTINARNYGDYGYRFAVAGVENLNVPNLLWQGGTININFQRSGYGGTNHDRGGLLAIGRGATFTITSNLAFNYIDESNSVTSNDYAASFVSAVGANGEGVIKLLGKEVKISINQFANGDDNRNYGLGGFALYAANNENLGRKEGTIYLNAKDDGTINDANATVQVTGGISTSYKNNVGNSGSGGKIYAHFTGRDSFLKGNIYAGRYDNGSSFSTLKMSFTNRAKMTGNIVFVGDAKESTSDIVFASRSKLEGDIYDLGAGNHRVLFDHADFIGSIKRDASNIEGVVGTSGNIGISSNPSNTIITFLNTSNRTFGDGINDIVQASYKGQIIGDFDMHTTQIRGNDGSKGFKGSGRNTLTFDFAYNTPTDKQQASNFTISGGNDQSVYTLDRFTLKGQNELDLTLLSATDHLYSQIEKAGINIAAEVDGGNGNHLNGTLQFRKTNIKVGDGDNALFANEEKILGTTNKLNGLAIGASFGNAIWNDANDDGGIGADEIVENKGGVNYKLISQADTPSNGDENSSTGNIGKENDEIRKAINFIFTDGSYQYNGATQGYTGVIKGGTDDSRYAFANAGFLNQAQIEDAKGKFVLFETALKGDLGVKNKSARILLDFSNGRNGLFSAYSGVSNGNIVGSGAKDIVFNFTKNTNKDKYTGAVVGKADGSTTPATNAKFTMLNLKAHSENGTLKDNGVLGVGASDSDKTINRALQLAGLTNFNNTSGNNLGDIYGAGKDDTTNIEALSTTNTTIALKGTSLDASHMTFKDYIYDFAFGSGFDLVEGIALEDSTLSGVIDLTAANQVNPNEGHKFTFKGQALVDGGEAGLKIDSTKNITFFFDDTGATYTDTPTFKLEGYTVSNKLSNTTLKFTNTNLEGNLFVGDNVNLDLNFTNGRTWKMSESEMIHRGGNLFVHGDMKQSGATASPVLKLLTKTNSQRKVELINTGATLKWQLGDVVSWNTWLGQKFKLRGTTLEVYFQGWADNNLSGLYGRIGDNPSQAEGFDLTFAKGSKLQTTQNNLKITDSATGEGNYIAESYGKFTHLETYSKLNITYIGEDSHNADSFNARNGHYEPNSRITFVNAGTNSKKLNGIKVGDVVFVREGFTDGDMTVTLEGTTVNNAHQIFKRTQNTHLFTYNMAFIKESSSSDGYVDSKYGELATTNANGALQDKILKVAESKFELGGALDFKEANYNILFGGKDSQNLSETNIIKGGSESSIITFRNASLNAGNDTSSSLQNIKGKIAFDLAHTNESSTISGVLGSMFNDANGDYNGSGTYLTKLKAGDDSILEINKLVFLDPTQASSSSALTALKANGLYFGDSEVFGENLSQEDYSSIGAIDGSKNSSLTFEGSKIALKGANQELVFIGANSHKFDESNSGTALGDSTGSTLTFIDAGELKVANIQNGKGAINLIGSSKIELIDVGTPSKKTLSLYQAATTGNPATSAITGEGLIINAVFNGANNLGTGVAIKNASGAASDITDSKGSDTNIGQAGEKTTYHLLFDYTDVLGNKTNKGFGDYWVYQGNIAGLESDSIIKFKNAGLIKEDQIAHTKATILVDNTLIAGDFRGDNAFLDYRNNRPSIKGDILTSDMSSSDTKLSRKILTFDLTNSSKLNLNTHIQAGYKIAPDYTEDGISELTFQNAPTLTLGNDTAGSNTSKFIQAIANDIGFNVKDAKTTEAGFNSGDKTSYILSGTELGFEGTDIQSSNSIEENLYSLNLSFDQRSDEERGENNLGSKMKQSSLTAQSIVMGKTQTSSTATNQPLNLSLAFFDQGSLHGGNDQGQSNTLAVKLENGARFNLSAQSSNGNIGTLILNQNDSGNSIELAKDSALSIDAGAMSFIGNFVQKDDSTIMAGKIKAHFNGDNKVSGSIVGRGEMDIVIQGNALFEGKANAESLLIDASNAAETSQITLAHASETVKVIGKTYNSAQSTKPAEFIRLNLANVQSDVILGGAFDLGAVDMDFGMNTTKTLKLSGDTFFKTGFANDVYKTLSLKDVELASGVSSAKLAITATNANKQGLNLNLVNFNSNITVILTSLNGEDTKWDNGSVIKTRGVNLELATSLWDERSSSGKKEFIFAKGKGTDTTESKKLHELDLDSEDRINESRLTINLPTYTGGASGLNFKGSMIFIGKDSLGAGVADQKIDGVNDSVVMNFGFFNSVVRSGSKIFDNTTINDDKTIKDTITLRGTDTFNLSVLKGPETGSGNNVKKRLNQSSIDAVFVKSSKMISSDGNLYIQSSIFEDTHPVLAGTLGKYETSNAGGALSQSILKTLQSKAYGNITMEGTVRANMKFIGKHSHSFDGSVAVEGSGENAKFYQFQPDLSDSFDGTAAKWEELEIGADGIVKIKTGSNNPSSDLMASNLAKLSGGNADSRFDFDHTNVRLDLIKDAGGKTYVYNSEVLGNIGVSGVTPPYALDPSQPEKDPSITLFFNAKMGDADSGDTQKYGEVAKKYVDYNYISSETGLGINLDLNIAHQMKDANLSSGKLGQTDKQTNIVLIGKKSTEKALLESGTPKEGIDLSFLPEIAHSDKYSFTIISGGSLDAQKLSDIGSSSSDHLDPSGVETTVFGKSKVILVDTKMYGKRNFAQVGFINTEDDDIKVSSWGGAKDIDQFLIFDFQQNQGQINNGQKDGITNVSPNSRYIFTNLFEKNNTNHRILTLGTDRLKTAINDQLGVADGLIGSDVVGYLGLRGVSVKGDIDESSNGVDLVFNSTDDISYIDGFDESGKHTFKIEKTGFNRIANISGISDISGYAILESENAGAVTIKGSASKDIVFIGANAVKGGFDKLKIQDGTAQSSYTFHSVGKLSNVFLQNVGLQQTSTQTEATLGDFKFVNSQITGNIDVDAHSSNNGQANQLIFEDVIYSGELSGSLKKDLSFAQGSRKVIIRGGTEDSAYDFSKVSSIDELDIDLSKSDQGKYYASAITGFDGKTSLKGAIKLAKNASEVDSPNYSNELNFNDSAKWDVTGHSRVMTLGLANSGNTFNLEVNVANSNHTRAQSNVEGPMLEVQNLDSDNGRALIHTSINLEDQSLSKTGKILADNLNGTLYVSARDAVLKKGELKTDGNNAIVLVEAVNADLGEVKGSTIKEGLRYSTTTLEHQEQNILGEWEKVKEDVIPEAHQRWVLASFETQDNQELVNEVSSLLSTPYRMLVIETNNLNKRMGELRDNDYAQGAWIRVFNGMDNGEGIKNLYTNVQLGYDYAFGVIGAKNYTGGAFSTSVTDITGNQFNGKGNTYSLALYNSYIADNGFYVDAIAKYLYMDQRLTPHGQNETKFGNHAYSLGVEVGHRVYVAETNFFVETQGEIVGGIIQGVKDVKIGTYNGVNTWGDIDATPSLSLRAGVVAGYTLKTQSGFRADFRIGASMVGEFVKGESIVLQDGIDTPIRSTIKNDNKVVLNLGTNLILTDKWRVYIDAERSFGGSRNTDYQASVGARFSFGEVVKSLSKDEIAPLKLKDDVKKEESQKQEPQTENKGEQDKK